MTSVMSVNRSHDDVEKHDSVIAAPVTSGPKTAAGLYRGDRSKREKGKIL